MYLNMFYLVINPSNLPEKGSVTIKCLRCKCLNIFKIFGKKSSYEHYYGFSIIYGLISMILSLLSSHNSVSS